MPKPTRIEVNCETGEVLEVELTDAEIAELEAAALVAEQQRLAQEAEEQAKADAKASAIAKLTALGLTAEEATALLS